MILRLQFLNVGLLPTFKIHKLFEREIEKVLLSGVSVAAFPLSGRALESHPMIR